MTEPAVGAYQPRRPQLVALVVFALAALLLCWPMLQGRFLAGPMSDQLTAGYAYRNFAAEHVKQYGSLPEWNPYMFGGIAFLGATHGNILYPATWLQWVMPTDTGMNLAFYLHFVLAGMAMFWLLRALGAGFTGAMVGGLGYEMTGIIASLVQPGHDGKLFVSALAPLMFLGLFRAVRQERLSGFTVVAIVTGLSILGHYQLAYYLLVAGAVWALWLAFGGERRATGRRITLLAAAGVAVMVGVGIAGAQVLPLLDYIPYSPRGEGGPSGGWAYATAYAMPVDELMSTILPEFNGVLQGYWGDNFFKLHTEYLGAAVVLFAIIGLGDRTRGSLRWILVGIAVLFLLVGFGGHTPFYRLWYEVMPMMKKVRAPGMAFYLVALVTCVFAGFGVDRIIRGEVAARTLWIVGGVLGVVALLAAVGGLQAVATTLADPRMFERVQANANDLQRGGLRLFVAVLAIVLVSWAILQRKLVGAAAAAALAVLVALDAWSVDRRFFAFSPPASVVFADDDMVRAMKAAPQPARVLDPWGAAVYERATLMTHDIPQVFGYHGQELRFYDELWGGKGEYRQQANPNLWDLFAVQFVLLHEPQAVPGMTLVKGPVQTAQGTTGYLYRLDVPSPYARVVGQAAKFPDAQAAAAVTDPRFSVSDVILLPDTASVSPPPLDPSRRMVSPETKVQVTTWRPGRMEFEVQGPVPDNSWLLIGEAWFKDWHATVDGAAAPVLRADYAAMAVPLKAGAVRVALDFHSAAAARGRRLSLASMLLAVLVLAASLARGRRVAHA